MSLLFAEGFDHYPNLTNASLQTQLLRKWNLATSGGSRQSGRVAGFSVRVTNANTIYIPSAVATFVAGFACRFTAIPGFQYTFFRSKDGSDNTNTELRINTDGSIALYGNGSLLATSASRITANTFYYFEHKATIANPSGAYQLKVDGQDWIASATGRTQGSGSANAQHFDFTASGGASNDFDDIYICDTGGAVNNDFLGPIRIVTLTPTADAIAQQLTPTGAANNWQCIADGSNPDDDTTFVSSGTVGNNDLYNYSAVGVTGTVKAVQITTLVRRDSTGSINFRATSKLGGTQLDAAATTSLPTTYTYNRAIMETDPTASAWTVPNVNSTTFGVKVAT